MLCILESLRYKIKTPPYQTSSGYPPYEFWEGYVFYWERRYKTYEVSIPSIAQLKFSDHIKKIANTSIDISDGLLADLDKLINFQKLSYKIDLKKIPISNYLKKVIDLKKLSKINYISNGDDYQVLFTASKNKRRIIKAISSNYRIKLTKIGSIQSNIKNSSIVDDKNTQISLKNKGYFHKF